MTVQEVIRRYEKIYTVFIVKGQHVKKQYQSSLEAGDKYLENLDYEKAEEI